MADWRNFQTPGLVDDTLHWSKVLQLFFSSENEMQKLEKKTQNIASKMRKQRVISVVWARGRQDGKLERASEASGQLRGLGQKCVLMALTSHSFTWDKNAFPLCCFSGF